MAKETTLDLIVNILIIIGAINWGLVGLFDLDLVAVIFGFMGFLQTTVYVLVGASGVYKLVNMFMK